MGQGFKVPALVSLTFHWYIMENQTPLSVHQAIKDKCACYCSHSVFLIVLCAPSGDVKACCRTAINNKLLVFFFCFFFIAKGDCCLAEDWPWLRAGQRPIWQAPLRTEWTGVSDELPVSFLNHKPLTPSETPTKASVAAMESMVPWFSIYLWCHTVSFCGISKCLFHDQVLCSSFNWKCFCFSPCLCVSAWQMCL